MDQKRWDIIIIGAGTAGCVLAARLSENPDRSVLLLEAGPDYPQASLLPPEIADSRRPAYTHDWGYQSEPGSLGRPLKLPRAKLTGGCTATNACFALRGQPGDYDTWAIQGNPGWSFNDVLPFFCKLESDQDFADEWHGGSGPIPIRRYPQIELDPVQAAFLEACSAAGHPCAEDLNAPQALGAGRAPMNAIAGVRQSTALTYLAMARDRPNLSIRSRAQADRVLFQGKRATGVRLADTLETLYAEHIILSAGTYISPAILMRSGLGPVKHLRALGIPVIENLAGVGENLQDHPLFGLRFSGPAGQVREEAPVFQTVLILKSSAAGPDYDLLIAPRSLFPTEDSPSQAAYLLFASLLKPKSRGRLRLRSQDPKAAPLIDLGYFTSPEDMPRMLEGVRTARQLAQTRPLSGLTLKELYPGPNVSDAPGSLEPAVLARVETFHHVVGTCAMGPETNGKAVVDARGNVYGVEGLAVMDAAIMPEIPAANTNLPALMLAERLSGLPGFP